MKASRYRTLSATLVLSLLFSACDSAPGKPRKNSDITAPSEIIDFRTLYAENCAGCHGGEGRGGAAIPLADPVYLAIVDETSMRKVIANGVHGTSMPAFAQTTGGMLTEQQIEVLTSGIVSHWSRPGFLDGSNAPSYTAKTPGNVASGEMVYETYCASCHGPDGEGGRKASDIVNDSFLALVSDQGLRTTVIIGRPELGAPDWRGNVPGKPMSNQEITDVVAWLASRRVQFPGQPYSASNYPPR
jgi:mono/diheme cytochrome c family protein